MLSLGTHQRKQKGKRVPHIHANFGVKTVSDSTRSFTWIVQIRRVFFFLKWGGRTWRAMFCCSKLSFTALSLHTHTHARTTGHAASLYQSVCTTSLWWNYPSCHEKKKNTMSTTYRISGKTCGLNSTNVSLQPISL